MFTCCHRRRKCAELGSSSEFICGSVSFLQFLDVIFRRRNPSTIKDNPNYFELDFSVSMGKMVCVAEHKVRELIRKHVDKHNYSIAFAIIQQQHVHMLPIARATLQLQRQKNLRSGVLIQVSQYLSPNEARYRWQVAFHRAVFLYRLWQIMDGAVGRHIEDVEKDIKYLFHLFALRCAGCRWS